MRRWIPFLAFILASVLDVHVRAEIVAFPREEAIQEPEGCFLQSSLCGLKSRRHTKSEIRLGEARVILGSDSILLRLSAEQFTVLKGVVWGRGLKSEIVVSEFGEMTFRDADVFISRESGRMLVKVLKGEIVLHPRGSSEELVVPAGFQNWIGPLGSERQGRTGVPEAFDLRGLISEWAPIYDGSREEFRKEIRKTQIVWFEALESSRQLHQRLAERHIASVLEEKGRREKARKAYDSETLRIRNLMLQRLER